MNSYIEMKQRHQAEVNAFPMKFAFTQESLERGMRELGLDPKKDMKKIVAIPGGGFRLPKIPRCRMPSSTRGRIISRKPKRKDGVDDEKS